LPLPGKDALLVSDGALVCVVAHFTSSVRGDRSVRRHEQRVQLARALPARGPAVVLVDANDEGPLSEFVGFTDVGAGAGATWGGTSAVEGGRAPRRIDRILVRDVEVGDVVVDRAVAGSDHWPLIACAETPAPRVRSYDDAHRALCLLPPPSLAQTIDVVRAAHDKAHPRWPPHINIAFPFVDDVVVYGAIARALVDVAAFTVSLGDSAVFGHGKCAATVVDGGACARLMRLAEAPLSTPHLTLSSDGTGARVGGSFDVDRVFVLGRDRDSAFSRVDEFVFGRVSLADAVAETDLVEPASVDAVPAGVFAALAALPGVFTVVGSTALGVRFVDSDIDVAWQPPPDLDDPLGVLLARLGGARTDAVAAPRVKTVIDGTSIDIVVGGADARAAAQAPLDDAQRQTLIALRLWARRRRLRAADNNAMPSSVAFLALVLQGARDATPGNALRAIWRRLADDDDVDAVSGTGFRGVTPASLATLRKEAARALACAGPDADGNDDSDAAWRTIFVARP